MKTATKVFIILSIVGFAFLDMAMLFYIVVTSAMDTTVLPFLAIVIFFAIPIYTGIKSLQRLEEAKTKNELTTIAIITLILCSFVAGILMLCMKDEDLKK